MYKEMELRSLWVFTTILGARETCFAYDAHERAYVRLFLSAESHSSAAYEAHGAEFRVSCYSFSL